MGFRCKLQQFAYGEGMPAAGCPAHTLQPPAEPFAPGVEGRTGKQGCQAQGGTGRRSEVAPGSRQVTPAKVIEGPVVELFAAD